MKDGRHDDVLCYSSADAGGGRSLTHASVCAHVLQVVVAKSLEQQLGNLKVEMGAVFKAQEEELLEKIQALETKLGKK